MAQAAGACTAPVLCIVLPCFNEEEVLPRTVEVLGAKLDELMAGGLAAPGSRALFVDDGSHDATWGIVSALAAADARFEAVRLAHNRGHQNALLAGLGEARSFCDVTVSMDADLQDDPNAIDAMLAEHARGANIVFGVRDDRTTDTAFKRGTAGAFYRLMRWLGADTIDNHADFRLMDRTALDALFAYGEANLFLRGVVADIGLETAKVYYRRAERTAGVSKYPLKKMLSFAASGVTSFSTKPLHIIGAVGLVVVLIAIVAVVYSLVQWALGRVVDGWTTTVCSIWFIGGVQLVCLAVLGEYIGRIYQEAKHRPRYLVQHSTLRDGERTEG